MLPCSCSCYSLCSECLTFPSSILSLAKISSKIQLPGSRPNPLGWERPSPCLSGHSALSPSRAFIELCSSVGFSSSPSLGAVWSPLYNQLPAKTLRTFQLKRTECPLDASLRIKLPSHSGGAHGRMDLRMCPACSQPVPQSSWKPRPEEGSGKVRVPLCKAFLKHIHFLLTKARL